MSIGRPRPGAAALEVGAWACYFDRRFAQAAQFAADGALAASDTPHPVPLPGGRRPDAGTEPGTWPRPSCCSGRPSRWPRGPTG